MQTSGETVYECKDKTDNALLHGTPRQNLQTLVHLSYARSVHDCAHHNTLHLTETRETGNRRRMPCMRLFLHNCQRSADSTLLHHKLGPCSQRFRHLASALSTTTLPAHQALRTSKGWVPDHCVTKEEQLHWRMCEPSNTSTMFHESQKRFRELTEKTREKICLHGPAKLPAQSGQKGKQPRCAAPAPTEGRV